MTLADFMATESIFIDANIWTYFALNTEPFQASCATFLYRLEIGQVAGVTSTAVLNEAFYAVLVGKASAELATTHLKQIHQQLQRDNHLAQLCYQTCLEFATYLEKLLTSGLQIVAIDYPLQVAGLEVGQRHGLMPTDALHVATCQQYGIKHIATADAHFKGLPFLQVWEPSR